MSTPHSEPPGARSLSWEELARSSGTSEDRLRELVGLGVPGAHVGINTGPLVHEARRA